MIGWLGIWMSPLFLCGRFWVLEHIPKALHVERELEHNAFQDHIIPERQQQSGTQLRTEIGRAFVQTENHRPPHKVGEPFRWKRPLQRNPRTTQTSTGLPSRHIWLSRHNHSCSTSSGAPRMPMPTIAKSNGRILEDIYGQVPAFKPDFPALAAVRYISRLPGNE